MNKKLYLSKRQGALGALMDLYEQEAELFFETLNKVPETEWGTIKDAETEDDDCRSIQSICEHLVGAAKYYIELLKKGENADYEIGKTTTALRHKKDFEPAFRGALALQSQCFEGRWNMNDKEIESIKIKTGWGSILDPDSLMEHAILHVMRHHRQILKFLDQSIKS